MHAFYLLFTVLCITLSDESAVYDYQPQQIHLSYGGTKNLLVEVYLGCDEFGETNFNFFVDKTNDIVVTWSTMDDTPDTLVKFGEKEPNTLLTGTSTKFVDGGDAKHTQYIHRVSFI